MDKLKAIVGLGTKEEQEKVMAKELNLIVEELTASYYIEEFRKAAIASQKKTE